MISNQILQTTIEGLKGITRIDLCICDTEGKVLAATFPDAEEYEGSILAFVDSPADSQVIQGYQFFKVFDEHQLGYILLTGIRWFTVWTSFKRVPVWICVSLRTPLPLRLLLWSSST